MEVTTMPLVTHPRVRKGLCRLATLTAFGVFASTGVAAAACPAQPTTTPFAQFGDTHSYFLVPGSDFAAATLPAGWTASNASLTPGAEPFDVGSSSTQSLTINAGGSVRTAYECLDSTMPSLRFFAEQNAPGGDLALTLIIKLPNGARFSVPLTRLADGSMPAWAPTQPLGAPFGLRLPAGMTVQAALRFSVPGNAGSWSIDDIYVDPYSFG